MIAPSAVARLDAINIGLMLTAAAVACVAPVELFAISYVVLGPLHYLTQLTWLRDRGWFTPKRSDAWFLVVPAVLLSFGRQIDPLVPGEWRAALVLSTVLAAAVLVASGRWWPRLPLLVAAVGFAWAVRREPGVLLLSVMLPTAVHIFVFTGGFVLTGALRNRSGVGGISFVLFVTIPMVLLFMPVGVGAHAPPPVLAAAVAPFAALRDQLGAMFGFSAGELSGIDRFLGWGYSYHYLNWFSKTRLIGWHRSTYTRLGAVGVAWLACVAFYAIDYTTGFVVVGLVGMLHVVLELPLDVRTFAGLPGTFGRAARPVASG